jgi:hypothetical protein
MYKYIGSAGESGGLPLLLNNVDEVQVASVVPDMRSRQTFLDSFCETELEGLEAALDVPASDYVRLSSLEPSLSGAKSVSDSEVDSIQMDKTMK